MSAESQQAFESQRFGATRWRPRNVPNVYGIIEDLHEGRTPPAHRFEARPALKDTGHLQRSITFDVIGKKRVAVGTNLPKAAKLHGGGNIESRPLTPTLQEKIRAWLRTQDPERQQQLGFLTAARNTNTTLQGRVPARPIVGVTRRTQQFIQRTIGVRIFEVGSRGNRSSR